MRDSGPPLSAYVIVGVLFLGIVLCGPLSGSCSAGPDGEHALTSAGYTDVKLGGYAWFSCSDSDTFASTFTATNPAGAEVSGTVCCGWMKACTVRF